MVSFQAHLAYAQCRDLQVNTYVEQAICCAGEQDLVHLAYEEPEQPGT